VNSLRDILIVNTSSNDLYTNTLIEQLLYVTGFGKTDHVRTRIEIHFIACYNSHTQALSRHSDTIAIDKKVCFYRWLFANPIRPCRTITDPVGPLGGFNKVACTWSQTVPLDVCSPRGMVRFAVAICLAHCAHNLVACV